MKFRIEGKDLAILGIFAVILFYLCCLATGNISTLSTDGSFAGLNPFPGLAHFGVTLLLFIVLFIGILAGTSSSVFERKKGFGFEISEKDNKGYSRWAKEKEIKTDKDVEVVDPLAKESNYAGIPLVNDGKKLWVDNGEYHNLVIGATGSGKSQTVVEPMVELLIKKGESMVITDPKGELYRAASDYMKDRGYNVIVLNFRDPQNGNAWNPLTLPYQYYKDGNTDKATEILDDVALNILYDPNNKGEPFWEKSAADYFSGLALGLFEDAKEEEINLNSINFMSTVGEDKFATSNFIKEYFTLKGEASNAYVFASNTINSPADTKGGILSVFRQKIRLFASRENLSEMLSHSDFDMRDIGKKKTAVFIVIQDEKTTYHSLATIFIKQVYETLIDVAQNSGGKLPFRTNFILDEFANMPPLKDVGTMVTAARSRDIRFTFIIQNFAQLKGVYGAEVAETIRGNCGNLVYLISTELAALEEISKMCGEVKSGDKDKTASTPLVTVTDLQKLKLFEAIIIRWRKSPFKTKYTPNFKMDWGHPHNEAKFPVRDKQEIALFDVKEFVKNKKRDNMLNSLDSGSSKSPFGGSSPFGSSSPFGGGNSSSGGGLFGGGGFGGGLDLDAMMKDIDRKIAELDAEEAKQKEELDRKKKEQNEVESKDAKFEDIKEEQEKSKDEEEKIEDFKLDVEDKKDDNSSIFDIEDTIPNMPSFSLDAEDSEEVSYEPNEDDNIVPIKEDNKDTKKEQLNIYDDVDDNDFEGFNLYNSDINKSEISIGKDIANIAVGQASPDDDEDLFEIDALPTVQNASIIKPNYQSGSVTKPNDNDNHDILEKVPNFMDGLNENKKEKENDTNVNLDPDTVVIDNNVISDDEFFDDFFGDD